MKKLLFISKRGDSSAIAQRMAFEGNKVAFFILDEFYSRVGDGLVEKVPASMEIKRFIAVNSPDCVIFDDNLMGLHELSMDIQKLGIPTFGSSQLAHELGNNVRYLQRVLKTCNLAVSKQELLMRSDDVLVTINLWVNKGRLLAAFYIFEEDTLIEGHRGPSSLWMGSIGVRALLSDPLISEHLKLLIDLLTASNFYGQLSVKALVSKDNVVVCKVVPYFDYSSIFGVTEVLKHQLSDLFTDLAIGSTRPLRVRNEWFIQVAVCIMPFPVQASFNLCFNKEVKITPDARKHVWLLDVYKNGKLLCAGTSGRLYMATARGDSVREARRRAYKTIDNLYMVDSIYRPDIGNRAIRDYQKLQEFKMAKRVL